MRDRARIALGALALGCGLLSSPALTQLIEAADVGEPPTQEDDPAPAEPASEIEAADVGEPSAQEGDPPPAGPASEIEAADVGEPSAQEDDPSPAEPASETEAADVGEPSAQKDDPPPAEPASEAVVQVANWVVASGDHGGLPFIVIDKIAAAIFAFDATGQFMGTTPALLGVARGDESAPGIGNRALSAIRTEQRTTPAGRFPARIGRASGKYGKVLWVDYATSLALHPVIAIAKERRLQRLKSPSSEDNRITYGCINVSGAFYRNVVRPLFTNTSGIVYILPETKPLNEAFPAFRIQAQPSLQSANSP